MRRLVRLAVVLVLALTGGLAPAAHAGRHLLFGVDDDTLKWTPDPLPFLADAHDLGVGAVRVTLPWRGLRSAASDDAVLTRLAAARSSTPWATTPIRTRRSRARGRRTRERRSTRATTGSCSRRSGARSAGPGSLFRAGAGSRSGTSRTATSRAWTGTRTPTSEGRTSRS